MYLKCHSQRPSYDKVNQNEHPPYDKEKHWFTTWPYTADRKSIILEDQALEIKVNL